MEQNERKRLWETVYFLINTCRYQILHSEETQNYVVLESTQDTGPTFIILKQENLSWRNHIKQKIGGELHQFENVRKNVGVRKASVLSLQFSEWGPVEDIEDLEGKKVAHEGGRLSYELHIITEQNEHEKREALRLLLNNSMNEWTAFPSLTTEEMIQRVNQEDEREKESEIQLFQKGKPFFTYVFLVINVVMFLLLELSGGSTNSATLVQWGAKFNPYIEDGQWWRFITPMFLHIGFLHLLMNSYALYFLGRDVERIYGRIPFLIIYLVSGFTGSVLSFYFSPSISAGASGAIFGCFGALLYIAWKGSALFKRRFGSGLYAIVFVNLLLGFTMPGIDNYGHIGGLIGGFLLASAIGLENKKLPIGQRVLFGVIVILFIAVSFKPIIT